MRIARMLLIVMAVAGVSFLAVPAGAQTRSPCAPGGPASRPANPSNPSQYPPNECGLRLGQSQARPGERVDVAGDGYRPNSTVTVEFRSAPTFLASVQTNSAGSFAVSVTIPADASSGRHTIAAVGVNPNGTPRELTADITIVASGAGERGRSNAAATLPRTGAGIAAAVGGGVGLIVVGLFAVRSARRRTVTP